MKASALQGLYGISDTILTPYETLELQLKDAIKGGLKIFQLRNKTSDDDALREKIYHLSKLCAKNNVLFVLNDRVELASRLKIQALHIGRNTHTQTLDDTHYLEYFSKVRKQFSGILGASAYGDISLAKKLENLGADYVAFGAIFPSITKPKAPCIGVETLSQAKEVLRIPICAIGGISKENINLLKIADMCALISDLWDKNPLLNAQILLQRWRT
ncbi:thiamine phosphate synthase [Helicobacter sp. MIT 00-7814]|uniref:thiamine phosphate synthase n=1 Tax=unclassified Helicobacter TaxID=2593540 RepID=UPI000E1FA4FD|nr:MULTISPECIES: thiamine phosphate synthase [unclassified Helicobacter]RDU55026.1 thiamine phosphate synthase [Helicobacter sp. MIT 00-7814]RDU55943.1 thiamine phosphate synthase [Helicobacter sp. MIT 99-10781]